VLFNVTIDSNGNINGLTKGVPRLQEAAQCSHTSFGWDEFSIFGIGTFPAVDIGRGFCDTVRYLLVPSQISLDNYTSLVTDLQDIPPFNQYFSVVNDFQSNFATTTASSTNGTSFVYHGPTSTPFTINVNLRNSVNNLVGATNYNIFYNLIGTALWFAFGVYLFYRVRFFTS